MKRASASGVNSKKENHRRGKRKSLILKASKSVKDLWQSSIMKNIVPLSTHILCRNLSASDMFEVEIEENLLLSSIKRWVQIFMLTHSTSYISWCEFIDKKIKGDSSNNVMSMFENSYAYTSSSPLCDCPQQLLKYHIFMWSSVNFAAKTKVNKN